MCHLMVAALIWWQRLAVKAALERLPLEWLATEAAPECCRGIVVRPALDHSTLERLRLRAALECHSRLVVRQPTLEQPALELLTAGGLLLLLLLLWLRLE